MSSSIYSNVLFFLDDDNNFNQYGYEDKGFEKILDDDEFNQMLNENKFKDNQKQVLQLLYEGYISQEIAEITGRNKQNIYRTKKQIEKKLLTKKNK